MPPIIEPTAPTSKSQRRLSDVPGIWEAHFAHCHDEVWYDDGPGPLPLCRADLSNLRDSGLSDATIRRSRIRSENDRMVIPFVMRDGKFGTFCRYRLHTPFVSKDGKERRYLHPEGEPNRAYFPPDTIDLIDDAGLPLLIVEGEKKALAGSELEMPVVGLTGVYNWKVKDHEELIPDLKTVPWAGRKVYIAFDYDPKEKTRQYVSVAEARLSEVLLKVGAAEVLHVEMPPAADGGKQGLDDFLKSHGAVALRKLIEVAAKVAAPARPLTVQAGRTDAANAARLVRRFGNNIRYVVDWGKWIVWTGKNWTIDLEVGLDAFAKRIGEDLFREYGQVAAQGDRRDLDDILRFVRYSSSTAGVRNMISLARSEPQMPLRQADLDSDKWLLNCDNGTIDLRTGTLRSHSRLDLITKICPVEYAADAKCPQWIAFLDRIFASDTELIAYVQKLVGYSLTGSCEEHLLPFMYGDGANGKSTFAEVILKMMGDGYAMKAPPDLLLAKKGETHPTERADLFGKRFVACIETEAGRKLAESLVKELTGGDRIRARRMREDFWEFIPTHHVWLAGNHKPVIAGNDHGIWRRLKLIPFIVRIPDAEQDKKLTQKLTTELPGVLAWCVSGCLGWQRDGLPEPAVVKEATGQYRKEEDLLGTFIDECCDEGPDYSDSFRDLWEHYKRTEGELTEREFAEGLRRRGYQNFRMTSGLRKGAKAWRGVRRRVLEIKIGTKGTANTEQK